ncbi:hypothetical protein FGO68_gene8702 [Halteria grandinella]|uniref:Cyclin n=1 Tax=Halteria grandinella TaxID=5974 RepID=A0A8J8NMI3_HALGN|nr:hypothetical protein FGO68_gene8702 [Halteria grandinella]
MKLLTLQDYQNSVNDKAGIPEDIVIQMTMDGVLFTEAILDHFKIPTQVHSLAMTIFHLFIKSTPFTEVDRFLLSTVCTNLGCKIEAYHIRMVDFAQFYHENKKGGPKKRKPFEELSQKITEDMTDLELKVLRLLEFDFNIDTPYLYLRNFRDRHIMVESDPRPLISMVRMRATDEQGEADFMMLCGHYYAGLKRCLARSYSLGLCLYFPPSVIASALILLFDDYFSSCSFELGTGLVHTGTFLTKLLGTSSMLGLTIPAVQCSAGNQIQYLTCLEYISEENGEILQQQFGEFLEKVSPSQAKQIAMIDVMYVANQFLTKGDIINKLSS